MMGPFKQYGPYDRETGKPMTKRETIAEMLERGAELQTKAGHDVRIFMTDGGGPWPVLGAYYDSEAGRWRHSYWRGHGQSVGLAMSLIEKPQARVYERWVNVYEGGEEFTYYTREKADTAASRRLYGNRIACIHIRQEYTVGEGLEDETANQEDTDNE